MDERLKQIQGFYKEYHRLPSYAEMLSLFKLKSKNSVHKIVKQWLEKGFLQKINNKLAPAKKFFQLPLLGLVKAGFPLFGEEMIDFMSLDEYLIEKPQASFLLQVSGDSLKDLGILEGDLVVLERKNQALNGEIVLVYIDNQWVLKIFQKIGRKICLKSANKKYANLYPRQKLQIFAVVKGVVRKI